MSKKNTKDKPEDSLGLTNIVKEELNKEIENTGNKMTLGHLIVKQMIQQALDGDFKATKFLLERYFGKASRQKKSEEDKVLKIRFSKKKKDHQ
jgi:hypothetical protein